MKINFTNKQYNALLKIVYLGNWMANANRVEDSIEEFEQLESYIFSFAKDFGLEHYSDAEITKGVVYPTRQFEEESGVEELKEEYEEETFWEEIADRLAERDLFEKYSREEIEAMDTDNRINELYTNINKWQNEFETHGLSRLQAIKMTMKTKEDSEKNK